MLAVRLFPPRRDTDAVRGHAPGWRRGARPASASGPRPWALIPAIAGITLYTQVDQGLEGGVQKKATKDYWSKNLKTWMDAPLPRHCARRRRGQARSGEALALEPGSDDAREPRFDTTLARIPLTGGAHWKHLKWTMDGRPVEPTNDQGLYVFTPATRSRHGDRVTIGWSWDGRRFRRRHQEGGSNTEEFILPSGVVLTWVLAELPPGARLHGA